MSEAEWGEMFKMMDDQGTGSITAAKFPSCVRAAGLYPTEDDIKQMLDKAGAGAAGKVSYDKYLEQMKWLSDKGPLDINKIAESFKMFDKDDNGTISQTELKHVLVSMGDKLSSDEADEFVKEATVDNNGNLIYLDFLKSICD